MPSLDWDAGTYHRISSPQEAMAREVLDRLVLGGDETVLDAGCGSGRVTALLAARVPRGRVIAVDASPAMVAEARRNLGPGADVRLADLTSLDLGERVDAVFSAATFHWVLDHRRLFERLAAVLRPGGVLVAQCGGAGNAERFFAAVGSVAARPEYAGPLRVWEERGLPWRFAGPAETESLLAGAGFAGARCWLEERPMVPEEPRAFLATVMLRAHLEPLDPAARPGFVDRVLAALPEPVTIDYVRLNIDARRAG